jgi:hypothetical protein
MCPSEILTITSLFTVETPSDISYKWLTWDFSLLFVPFLIIIPYIYLKIKQSRKYYNFIFVLILWNIIYAFIKDPVLFVNGYYETILSMLIGTTMAFCFYCALGKNINSFWQGYQTSIVIAIIIMFIGPFTGLSSSFLEHGILNLPQTGRSSSNWILGMYICSWMYFYKTKNNLFVHWLFVFFLLILMFLSTQRASLLVFMFLLAVYFLRLKKINMTVGFVIVLSINALFFFSALLIFGDFQPDSTFGRIQSLFSTFVSSGEDESVGGRFLSFTSYWMVLQENPLGLSACFIDHQRHIREFGYPTFVHNAIMYLYTLLGPISLYVFYKYYKRLRKSFQSKSPFFWGLLFVGILDAITGNVYTNYKFSFYLVYLMLLDNMWNSNNNCSINKKYKNETFV